MASEGRVRHNQFKIDAGKRTVLERLNTVDSRCRGIMHIDLPESATGAVGFMDCRAKVYADDDEPVLEGQYESSTCTHAEMNALVEYIRGKSTFASIRRIEITSPPCKSCALVLELLGVIDKVYTTGDIYKAAPGGSWRWPELLKDCDTFPIGQWRAITDCFADSGLSDAEILAEVVNVVQRQSI